MTTKELKEQLQEDVTSFLGDFIHEQELTELCQIIIDRVNEFEISNINPNEPEKSKDAASYQ